MDIFKGMLGLAIILLVGGVIIVFSGVINVAATSTQYSLIESVLRATMENSVHHHAKDITAPPLDDPKMVMEGFRHYRKMCVGCHLAPGKQSSPIREGLDPEPPKLMDVVQDWKPAELFWIIKNGVKMTGMPAWGPTHSDHEIWDIVAFLEKLPSMNIPQYNEMANEAEPNGDDNDHQ